MIDLRSECRVSDCVDWRCSPKLIDEATHMGDTLGVGSSQPRLHFDNSDEALLEVLKRDII